MTLPPPSPIEIENELAKLRSGLGSFYKWTQLDRDDEGPRRSQEADLLARQLFWVVPITPENVQLDLYGAGETPAEAAAAAWVHNAIYRAWWLTGPIREAEYLAVPRRVPPGWEFDLVTP